MSVLTNYLELTRFVTFKL